MFYLYLLILFSLCRQFDAFNRGRVPRQEKKGQSGEIEWPNHAGKNPNTTTLVSEPTYARDGDSPSLLPGKMKQSSPVTTFAAISQLSFGPPPSLVTLIEEPRQPQIIIQIEDIEPGSSGCQSGEVANLATSDVPALLVDSPSDAPSSSCIHPYPPPPGTSSCWVLSYPAVYDIKYKLPYLHYLLPL